MTHQETPAPVPRDEPQDEPHTEPPRHSPEGDTLAARLGRIEALLAPARARLGAAEQEVAPAWRRATRGEPRWAATLSVLVVMAIQLALPARLAGHPQVLMPAVEAALLGCLIALNPHRIEHRSRAYRTLSLVLTLAIGGANLYSVIRLVRGLVEGTDRTAAGELLLTGGAIWLINIVIFALVYWELDRGGPAARAHGERDVPDFLFPQLQSPELAPPDWEPAYLDYFYLSFTNSTAFSPTDVLPVTRNAKLCMLGQSAVSLITVVLVVARAVNILN
ncbi:DUF1345 domain-containing protein [Actinacidiphila yanglinensis]|uniref:DUF1345 domain-containing protein n=1 Tax=Actinacidiphila yanglinensis TaxID=310779 RepID=UPI001F485E66|nr:DUF1345 domain-containing protein [Actinacidiphila yanglinensis]